MALDPLAWGGDLTDRNITVPGGFDSTALLNAASDAVRDAAGCAISQVTSTVTFVADDLWQLDLPFGPVSDVASVTVGGVPLVGWSKIGDTVTLPTGWTDCVPAEITVTYTHGYPNVPADIVDLVCGMVAIAFGQDGDYGSNSRLRSVRLGDYAETSSVPAGADSPSPMALPDSVRARLRARFGSAAVVLKAG